MQEKSMKKFTIIWIGQFLSILGSGVSAFGLSIWVLKETSSTTSFALTFLAQILPGILFAPIAGSLADRKKRKNIILLTDSFDAVLKLVIVFLLVTNRLRVWMIYPIGFLSATMSSLQGPAFSAIIPSVVPKDQLGRANGMMQLIRAIQSLIAPIIAGALYSVISLSGLFVIDFITFIVAILTMLPQSISQKLVEKTESSFVKTIVSDFKFTMNYIKSKTGLMQLIVAFSVLNFLANLVMVLIGPLVMANYDAYIFGIVNSVSGVAMIVGGLIAGIIPAKKNKVRSIFISLTLSGIGLSTIGVSPNWIAIATGFFIFMLPLPFANGTLGTLLQTKIEPTALGRVGAIMGAMLQAVTPIAIISAGLLADYIFKPLLIKGGALTGTWLSALIGEGSARGIGLMFIISGILLTVLCVSMLLNKIVMNMEHNIPDVIDN